MTFGLREREREMANSIPIFRERESKWKIPIQFSGTGTVMKIPFPFSGTGMRVKNSIPDFRDGNWRTVFPGIPGNGNGNDITKLGQVFVGKLSLSLSHLTFHLTHSHRTGTSLSLVLSTKKYIQRFRALVRAIKEI